MANVTVKSGTMNGGVLSDLSHEWCKRPPDERIVGKDSMDARRNIEAQARGFYDKSKAIVVNTHAIEVVGNGGLAVKGPSGGIVYPSFWGMTQLCQRAGVPASYLREDLSENAPLAALNLNYGLRKRSDDRVQMLLTTKGEHGQMVACTGPTYGRVWNYQILAAVNRYLGPEWTVPGIFGQAVGAITQENTSLFLSAQDMFIGLSDEAHKIEIPNRRGGKPGMLSRGILVGNSEVGAGTLKIWAFLFDYACANRNLWGVEDFTEISIRHTSGAPERFIREAQPAIRRFLNAGTSGTLKRLEAARSTKLDDPFKFLTQPRRFTKSAANAIIEIHKTEEHRPIENLWDANVGATAYARTLPWQDDRLKIEEIAGAFMSKA